MLTFLHAENVALIKQLDIDFSSGFTVLTGETGSGKSMVIDSIKMILGYRPPKDIIRNGENECFIYAIFDSLSERFTEEISSYGIFPDDDGVLMISRKYSSDGKSVFKINNRTVPASLVKMVASGLVSINEQHDSFSLLNRDTHIGYLDSFASAFSPKHKELIEDYKKAYTEFSEAKKRLNSFVELSKDGETKLEFLKFQKNEIAGAKIKSGEEEALLTEKERVKSGELISNAVRGSLALLSGGIKPGAYDKISSVIDNVEKIQEIVPESEEIISALNDILSNIEDVASKISRLDAGVFDDPASALDKIETRLDLIARIKKKYGDTEEEILSYLDDLTREINEIESFDFTLAEYEKALSEALAKVTALGKKLEKSREEASAKLTEAINKEFTFLDMEKVLFKVKFSPLDEPYRDGLVLIDFIVRTNTGEPFKPLSDVASGGELSRIMLALKTVLSECDDVGSIIFDEIDSGVSGKTSSKIGISLKNLSSSRQVVCVTHSAQVSAMAHNHLKIYKEELDGRTHTRVIELDTQNRIQEIARILGGVTITESVINTAKELINQGINN